MSKRKRDRTYKKVQGEPLIMSFSETALFTAVGTKTLLTARGACEYTGSQGACNNEQNNSLHTQR